MGNMPKDFLWGGALAAHQFEGGWNQGGKGPSVVDVMTAGAHGVPRKPSCGVHVVQQDMPLPLRRRSTCQSFGQRIFLLKK